MSATDTATATSYAIDPTHSSVDFAVRHLMISKVRGSFTAVSGTIRVPATSLIPSAVSAEIESASIATHEPQRDTHLKSPDFFNVEAFPRLRFSSTSIVPINDTEFTLNGTLEILGTARPVTLAAEVSGSGKDPWGNDRVAYEATTRINREDFGLSYNQALEAGGVLVGKDIDITLNIEAVLAK